MASFVLFYSSFPSSLLHRSPLVALLYLPLHTFSPCICFLSSHPRIILMVIKLLMQARPEGGKKCMLKIQRCDKNINWTRRVKIRKCSSSFFFVIEQEVTIGNLCWPAAREIFRGYTRDIIEGLNWGLSLLVGFLIYDQFCTAFNSVPENFTTNLLQFPEIFFKKISKSPNPSVTNWIIFNLHKTEENIKRNHELKCVVFLCIYNVQISIITVIPFSSIY